MRSSTPLPRTIRAKPYKMSINEQPADQPWTILRALQWTAGYFSDRGIENPRADAEILLAATLGYQRIDLYLRHDQPLHADELAKFRERIQRRIQREPVAYITGTKEFWSLDFKVTPDVLIPRPETEGLVEAALQLFPDDGHLRVLDLGVGSGAITIALAHERNQWRFWAADLSEKAIEVARLNASVHRVEDRIHWLVGSWFSGVKVAPDETFDLIVSNPPYIAGTDLSALEPEVCQYEPRVALDGGPDGLESIAHILHAAPMYMRTGGWLLLEIGYDQGAAVKDMARKFRAFDHIIVEKDFAGLDRVARFRKASGED
jgi:release factor glutamine methyltransferase